MQYTSIMACKFLPGKCFVMSYLKGLTLTPTAELKPKFIIQQVCYKFTKLQLKK